MFGSQRSQSSSGVVALSASLWPAVPWQLRAEVLPQLRFSIRIASTVPSSCAHCWGFRVAGCWMWDLDVHPLCPHCSCSAQEPAGSGVLCLGALCYQLWQDTVTSQELLPSPSAIPGLAVEVSAWEKGSFLSDCERERRHQSMKHNKSCRVALFIVVTGMHIHKGLS